MLPTALTIAGSDSGGGAGIQADLKTFQELGVFGTSALTAITAQNTLGVHAVQPVEKAIVTAQIEAVLDDFSVAAIKTGMLFSAELIETIAHTLHQHSAIPLVIDPVMIAKGGASLLQQDAVAALRKKLLPLATIVTPNVPEAETLTGLSIQNEQDLLTAGERILAMGASAVLLKGGHRSDVDYAEDLLLTSDGNKLFYRSARIDTKHTHGTGCTFAAAITAELAKGEQLSNAVLTAKQFIQAAIQNSLQLGHGHGPTNHAAFRQDKRRMVKEVELIAKH